MKNTQPLGPAKKNTPACLRFVRCFPSRGSHQPDSESEGEGEVDNSASLSIFVDPISGDSELDINPSSVQAVRINNLKTNEEHLNRRHRKLSLRARQAFTESITGLGIDDEFKQGLISNTKGLFEFTGSLEEGAKKFGSQFLGIENSDDELESMGGGSDDKSAELTPRLEANPQSDTDSQRLASESYTQISRVTERPSSEVINPKALTIGNVEPEDPNFSNELKMRAFDYINQVCEFGLDIEEQEKIKYFNISMDMIEEKKAIILESYNSSWKRSAVNLVYIREGSQISADDKIKLFDLVNNKIELPPDNKGKINQLIFVLKALKFKKTEILNGLDKRIRADTERPGSTR
jgi:hypothetical protein